MLRLTTLLILFLLAIQLLPEDSLQAQHHAHPVQEPVFSSSENARSAGELTLDEALLQKFYAGYRPSLLHESFRPEIEGAPVKCMVPAMMQFHQVRDQLAASTLSEIEQMTQSSKSSAEFSYLSPSGNFIFHYDTTGTDRVPSAQTLPEAIEEGIPDYVYRAAFAADSSYRYQVEDLGFTDFIIEEPYVIDFRNFGFYGTTTVSGSTTFITVHSNFRNFPPNTHPEGNQIGALYVTLAHEIKHAIQYAANRWRGSAGSFNWIEMDATMMEEIVFRDVNDYYNYIMVYDASRGRWDTTQPDLRSIFGNPQNPIPGAYWHVTWMLYYAEEYGMDFWVDVWQDVQAEPLITFINAIENQLNARNESFGINHLRNHMWHLTSGERFPEPDFGFREREYYPNASITEELFTVPDSLTGTGLRSLAAQYVQASASTGIIGQPNIRLQSSTPGVGIGVVGNFTEGTTRKLYSVNEGTGNQQIQTPWSWNQLEGLYITIVNTNQNRTADYTLIIDSILPDEDFLAQNYPNPFSPTTRIEFSLNEPKNVRIDVHDSIGRRISTLVNDTLNEGFHYVDFDGSGLASGAYFYRIITDQTVTTNKMMLIK